MNIVTTEYIAASPEAVWDFISDMQRYPEWVIGTNAVLSTSTPEAGAGTIYREQTQIGSSISETTWHITLFDAPNVQIHTSTSSMLDAVLTMTVVPENGGTRLTHVVEGRLLPRMRPVGMLLEWLMRAKMVNDLRQTLALAKQIVEHEVRGVEPVLMPV